MMIWSACNSRHSNIENAYIPSEPDYTDSKMWYINLNDTDDFRCRYILYSFNMGI